MILILNDVEIDIDIKGTDDIDGMIQMYLTRT